MWPRQFWEDDVPWSGMAWNQSTSMWRTTSRSPWSLGVDEFSKFPTNDDPSIDFHQQHISLYLLFYWGKSNNKPTIWVLWWFWRCFFEGFTVFYSITLEIMLFYLLFILWIGWNETIQDFIRGFGSGNTLHEGTAVAAPEDVLELLLGNAPLKPWCNVMLLLPTRKIGYNWGYNWRTIIGLGSLISWYCLWVVFSHGIT